jgi:asparagine synthase (glutamine-hydrolysing)
VESAPRQVQASALSLLSRVLGSRLPRLRAPAATAWKLALALAATAPDECYLALVSQADEGDLAFGARAESLLAPHARVLEGAPLMEREMFWDLITYLPGDLLVKLDRAAMSVSLETRLPLLDHRVIELAWRLPLGMKVRNRTGKWILRQVLGKHVPAGLVERPKAGFAVPLRQWLRGPLREWAEALLNPRLLEEQGLLDSGAVQGAWREHVDGRRNWQYHLWDVLMLQAWLAEQKRDSPVLDVLPA